jgi:hypothetical protein
LLSLSFLVLRLVKGKPVVWLIFIRYISQYPNLKVNL